MKFMGSVKADRVACPVALGCGCTSVWFLRRDRPLKRISSCSEFRPGEISHLSIDILRDPDRTLTLHEAYHMRYGVAWEGLISACARGPASGAPPQWYTPSALPIHGTPASSEYALKSKRSAASRRDAPAS